MAFFRSEYQIGRGEVAESRVEGPFVLAFLILSGLALLILQVTLQNSAITTAVAVSMAVFLATVLRVELGVYILVAAMLLSPEISAGQVSGGGGGWRSINIRYGDILIIVIFLGVMLKLAFEGRLRLCEPSPINAAIAAYMAVALFSSLLAVQTAIRSWDKWSAFFVLLKMVEFYLLFFLAGNAVRTPRQIRSILAVLFLVAIIVSGYAASTIGFSDRVGAPFEEGGTEPNTLGGYLMLVSCVAMGLLLLAPRFRLRLLFAGIIALAFIPFLYTLSRASYLAMIAAFVTMSILGRRWWIFAVVVAVLFASPYVMPESVADRVNYTFQRGYGEQVVVGGVDTGLQVDKSTYERIYVWDKVWYNIQVWPWFGGGVNWSTVLDSQYARVLIETGLFGICAFLFLQFRLLKTAYQAHRWSNDWVAKGLALGMFSATVGLMVHSLGTISFLIVRIMEPYWVLMAMVAVARNLGAEQVQRPALSAAAAPRPPSPRPAPRARCLDPPGLRSRG